MFVLRLMYSVAFIAFFLTSALRDFFPPLVFNKAIASSASQKRLMEGRALRSIDELIKLLADKEARVRLKATRELASFADPRLVTPMLALLRDKDRAVRSEAARVLGVIKDPRAVRPLFVLMQDVNGQVKSAALAALMQMGADAAPVALDIVKKRNRQLRTWAMNFLITYSHVSVEPLVDSLKYSSIRATGPVTTEEAEIIDALKEAGDTAIELLLIALEDDDFLVRETSVIVLGKIGADRSVKPLIKSTLDKKRGVQRNAYLALSRIKGDEALSFLIGALSHKDKVHRDYAVKYLGERGDHRAVEPLISYLERVQHHSKRETAQSKFQTVRDIATALGDLKDKRAIAPLITLLGDYKQNFTAMNVLAGFGADAVEPLISASRDDNKAIRKNAVRVLGKIGDIRALFSLIDRLKDSDKRVRRNAAKALGGLSGPRVLPALLSVLHDNDPGVKVAAIVALKNIDDPGVIDPLISLLDDGNASVRYEAAKLLKTNISPKTLAPFIKALKDKSGKVRQVAAQAVGLLGDSSAIKYLHENLTDWPSSTAVGKSLVRLGWRPVSLEDKIYLLIAQQDGKTLRSDVIWPDAKKVLMNDLASGCCTRRHVYAVRSLAAIGKTETVPTLIKLLDHTKKMPGILHLFLNSRHIPLRLEARRWAKRHGYKIHRIIRRKRRTRKGWN